MSEHFNNLTPGQAERLAILAEEAAEVIQVVGKILRHGMLSRHPDGGVTNQTLLEKEIGHVSHAVNRLNDAGDVSLRCIRSYAEAKEQSIAQYLHHQSPAAEEGETP